VSVSQSLNPETQYIKRKGSQ